MREGEDLRQVGCIMYRRHTVCNEAAVPQAATFFSFLSTIMSPTRPQLLAAAQAFCDAFAASRPLDDVLAHFSHDPVNPPEAIEHGLPLVPFVGRPFVGVTALKQYFYTPRRTSHIREHALLRVRCRYRGEKGLLQGAGTIYMDEHWLGLG